MPAPSQLHYPPHVFRRRKVQSFKRDDFFQRRLSEAEQPKINLLKYFIIHIKKEYKSAISVIKSKSNGKYY